MSSGVASNVGPGGREREGPVVIFTPKAGWFRRDDELAAHDRAIRSLGRATVILPAGPRLDTPSLERFLDRAAPSLVWVREGVELPPGAAEHLAALPVPVMACGAAHGAPSRVQEVADILLVASMADADRAEGGATVLVRPRGVDSQVAQQHGVIGPSEVAADVSVFVGTPTPGLQAAVAALRSVVLVSSYGAGSGKGGWLPPDGRAALAALASSSLHLVEVRGLDPVPYSVFAAAAVGSVPLVLCDRDGAIELGEVFAAGSEVLTAGTPDEAVSVAQSTLTDRSLLTSIRAAAHARVVSSHLLEDRWGALLDRSVAG